MYRTAAHSDFDSMCETSVSLNQTKGKHELRNWACDPTSSHGMILNCYLLSKEKSVLSESVAFRKESMLKWRTTNPRILGAAQIGLDSLKKIQDPKLGG